MSESRRRFWEQVGLYAIFGLAALYFLTKGDLLTSAVFVVIAGFNLQLTLLWGLFLASCLAGLIAALLSVLWVVPLQFLPVPSNIAGDKDNKLHALLSAVIVGALYYNYQTTSLPFGLATATTIVVSVISFLLFLLAFKIRSAIKDGVVTFLLLPALKVLHAPIMLPSGQPGCVEDFVQSVRAQCLTQTEFLDLESGDGALWTNVQVVGPSCVLDAAYLRHPEQSSQPPANQRWIMWFLGNGELYEFALPDLQVLCARSGLNVFAFNYRGVGSSTGFPHSAEDLVQDGILCMKFLSTSLSASPEHVLLFGHSLGGAIAPLVRVEVAPHGPVVSERSFCSLGAAARSVLVSVVTSATGFTPKLPQMLVQGLLNSVFKGHLDVTAAWETITGERLVVYTLRDAIIPYKTASLHAALVAAGREGTAVQLTVAGNIDAHNTPLQHFAEYETVLSRCRGMLGLPAVLPAVPPKLLPQPHHAARPTARSLLQSTR